MSNIHSPIPKYITSITIIQHCNTIDQQQFKNILDYLNNEYHDEESIVTDKTFDLLVELYEDKFGPYDVIGVEPNILTGEKVVLPYFLSSLKEQKNEKELDCYSTNYPGPYIIMDKVDGITVLLVHSANGVNKLYTRGKGVKGMDVSHLLDYIKFPPLNFNYDLSVRGELVITKDVFKKYEKEFKNARDMLSGKVIAKKSFDSTIVKDFSFFAYRIMNGSLTPEQDISYLINMGFLVPTPVGSQIIKKEMLSNYFKLRKELAAYDIDGLVIYQNSIIDYPKTTSPKQVITYKEESETVIVTVIEEES